MTLDEEIKHQEEIADRYTGMSEYAENEATGEECARVAAEHRQLAEWLTELKELREQIGTAKAMLLDSSYTIEVMCNKLSGTIGCEKCTYYNPETHDCAVRAYISRTRAFAKGDRASESN